MNFSAVSVVWPGGPVGLDTIAASVNESRDSIEDVYEPYLIQLGYIDRTPRGRIVTARGYAYFGREFPKNSTTDEQERLI